MKDIALIFMLLSTFLAQSQQSNNMDEKVIKTEEEWKKILSREQYHILREKGTDLPGTGKLTDHFKKVPIIVLDVTLNCLNLIRNMNPIVDGLPLMMPLKELCAMSQTEVMG